MQLAGVTDAGQTVERFGRYHADKAREILRQLSPVGGRISSEEILNNPWRLFSDEGLAWLIGSVGDTGAKQLPSILGYMSNPLLGAALGGTSEGVAFYEQLTMPLVSSSAKAASYLSRGQPFSEASPDTVMRMAPKPVMDGWIRISSQICCASSDRFMYFASFNVRRSIFA